MKLDQNTASTIVRNVLGAANQRAQIQIEADLHVVPVKEVKALLRDAGIDLRSLKGDRKSSGWCHGDTVTRKKHYKKPEILPGPPEKPEELEEQAKKVYEEFGVPAYLTESEQKAAADLKAARTISSGIEETAAEKQQTEENAAEVQQEELLGQPCTDPSTMLLYGEAPQKIASLEEVFDGLRAKVEKLRDQRRELAEQLRKTDDLLAYISMRCDIITETAEGTEKKDPADCLTCIGET
jgi:hypothetical protein